MNVGMLTTWNTRCGISEYSRYLVEALRRRNDVDVTVFGSKNYDEYKIAEDESYVVPVFDVLPWNNYGHHSFDYQTILESNLDVLHVQYEVMLYNQEGFNNLVQRSKALNVITYHDNCIPPTLPSSRFDLAYTHREDVGVGPGYIIPMGIENYKPVVKTFGLGRSRKDIIGDICKKHGWDFQYKFGEDKWIDRYRLYRWLRDSDIIVLYYDDTPAAGVSIAARVAISTRRPVIVNNVTWFKDIYEDANVWKVNGEGELLDALYAILGNALIGEASWDKVAEMHVDDYKECLRLVSV